jgi:dihydrofolate reductase
MYDVASWRKPHGLPGGESGKDADVLDEAFKNAGAVLMGRRMFDEGEGPWGEEPPFHMPVFVLTHSGRETMIKQGGTTFAFVTDGIESGLKQARAAAGDKDVSVAGGANTIQQLLKAGLLDELQIHIVPVLLGDGVRLFDRMGTTHIEMEKSRVIDSPGVTHLRFRALR